MKIPTIYYYVPPCPVCKSRRTGRYIKEPFTEEDKSYAVRESLKHGELVRICPSVPIKNAYCEDCGHEWPAHIYARLWDREKVREEMEARNTIKEYAQYQKDNPRKKRTLIGKITGFIR